MTISAIITLGITLLATILLIGNWLRPDLVALLVLVTLGITRLVSPEEALAGFSGSAVITILAITVIAEGLQQTGITYRLGQRMKRLAGNGEGRLIAVVMLAGATLSLFMNNIAAMAVLMPAVMGLTRQTHIPPSRLLIPLAYGVIAGGMATLFTTSNLITSSALRDAGLKPFGVLDFLPVGLPLVIIVIIYMLVIGRRLLPKNENDSGIMSRLPRRREDLLTAYRMVDSLWEVTVQRGSAMAGLTIQQGEWRNKVRLNVLSIVRKRRLICSPPSDMLIREGDLIFAQGEPDEENLRRYGLRLEEKKPSLVHSNGSPDTVAEIVLAPHSQQAGKTLREIHFREKWNLTVLALWRVGKPIHVGFANMPLQVGDGMLVQGTVNNLRILGQERDFIILEEDVDAIARPNKATLATAIGLVTLAVAITGWLPIALVCLAGAVAMILAGCLSMDEAYHAIDWKSIFLIAGMWPLSIAIQSSGLSDTLVNGLLDAAEHMSPLVLVALLLFTTMALANTMTGQAAAPIILAPIGLTIAAATGSDPRTFLMAIALGCSLVFPSPIGHPVNIIAMGSGGYTFKDFLRVGSLLTLLLFPAILLGLHLFWDL